VTKFQPKNKTLSVKFNPLGQNKLLETRKDKKNKKRPFKLLLNPLTRSSWSMSWERLPTTRISSISSQTIQRLSEWTMNTKSYSSNTKKKNKKEKRMRTTWQSTRRTCKKNLCNFRTTSANWHTHTTTW
jgi:hypothetical protein